MFILKQTCPINYPLKKQNKKNRPLEVSIWSPQFTGPCKNAHFHLPAKLMLCWTFYTIKKEEKQGGCQASTGRLFKIKYMMDFFISEFQEVQ